MDALLSIGPSKESVEAAKGAILAILAGDNSDKVKVAALKTLSTICHVSDTTVRDCNFTTDKSLIPGSE